MDPDPEIFLPSAADKSPSVEDISSHYYPAPGRGTGYCFRAISFFLFSFFLFFLSFFLSLSATLRENGWTDLHEIFSEGVE